MKLHNQDKTKLVNSVFNQVHKNYDLMNDLMSFGIHRIWKKNLLAWMNPQQNDNIIDVASGTGDLAKIISEKK
jgi:ubiquinone/menaquinone biosynthesis C-methylase UbiE